MAKEHLSCRRPPFWTLNDQLTDNTDMKIFCIVLLAACGLAASEKRECRTEFGMNPFDVQRFSGDWYGVWFGVPFPQRADLTCLKYHYNATGEGDETRVDISMEFKRKGGDTNVFRMKSRPYIPGMDSVLQASVFDTLKPETHVPAVISVIGTDYDNFAVVHTCHEIYEQADDSFKRIAKYILWSRTTNLDATVKRTLQTLGTGYEPEAAEDMVFIDQSGC